MVLAPLVDWQHKPRQNVWQAWSIHIAKAMHLSMESKRSYHPKMTDAGETGNRTQNLLHSTGTVKYDAKKMSYH
jgi:hypothetical protein